MELNLTIDRGNSTIKLAAWTSDNECIDTERADASCRIDMVAEKLLSRLEALGGRIRNAAYCTVVPSHRNTDIETLRHITPSILDLTWQTPLPFAISYDTPSTLGADRIAAVAGAISLGNENAPMLIADIGTAATYDYVDETGTYIGGNICPGIGMRLDALNSYTALLPRIKSKGDAPLWGKSTETALRSGALRGIAAELEYYIHHTPENSEVFLTGGSVPLLTEAGLITFKHTYDPLLVHRGLNSIIHYNENL